MPNIENLKNFDNSPSKNLSSRFGNTPLIIDREQMEYVTAKNREQVGYVFGRTLTYGTIVAFVVLGLGSVTYMTIQQLKK
jgi:hypothetical protein